MYSKVYNRYRTEYSLYSLLTDLPVFYIVYKTEIVYNKTYYTGIFYFTQEKLLTELFSSLVLPAAKYNKVSFVFQPETKNYQRYLPNNIKKSVARRHGLLSWYHNLILYVYET